MESLLTVTRKDIETVKRELNAHKQNKITLSSGIPTADEIEDNGFKLVLDKSTLYLYTKVRGIIYRCEFDKVL